MQAMYRGLSPQCEQLTVECVYAMLHIQIQEHSMVSENSIRTIHA